MIEFVLTDRPTIMPGCCVVCGSQAGPVVDTVMERWGDRLYLCRLCVKRAAVVLGLVQGQKADELLRAADERATREKENAALTTDIQGLREKLGHEKKRAAAIQTLLEDAQARERLRANLAAEIAGITAQLQTVGD